MVLEIVNDASNASSKITHVEFILDETGSMSSCRKSTIDGFNEYVNGLRQDKNNSYRLSLVKFDVRGDKLTDNVRSVFVDLDLNEVPDLNLDSFVPGGMTNLNDAIGVSIVNLEHRLKNEDVNVIVIVLTDGDENASKEWNQSSVADLIERKKKDGWTITFLGANIDVQTVGRAYSVDTGNIKAYSTGNMGATMRGLASATVACASSIVTSNSASSTFFANTTDWTDGDEKNVTNGSLDLSSLKITKNISRGVK